MFHLFYKEDKMIMKSAQSSLHCLKLESCSEAKPSFPTEYSLDSEENNSLQYLMGIGK